MGDLKKIFFYKENDVLERTYPDIIGKRYRASKHCDSSRILRERYLREEEGERQEERRREGRSLTYRERISDRASEPSVWRLVVAGKGELHTYIDDKTR